MKKMKKILLLLGVGLLASCGSGHGTPIEPEKAEAKLQQISESMTSEEFTAPGKFKMASSLGLATNDEKTSTSATIAIAENYVYSATKVEESAKDEDGKTQTETTHIETWIYVEDKTIYMVQDDHEETKQYMKQELPTAEAAKTAYDETVVQLNIGTIKENLLGASETLFSLATEVVQIAKDFDAFLTENKMESENVTHKLELASKNEGHLYTNFDLTYRYNEVGDNDEVLAKNVLTQKSEIEFENNLPVYLDFATKQSSTYTIDGKEVTDFEQLNLGTKMEYNFKVSKPDLSKFALAQL